MVPGLMRGVIPRVTSGKVKVKEQRRALNSAKSAGSRVVNSDAHPQSSVASAAVSSVSAAAAAPALSANVTKPAAAAPASIEPAVPPQKAVSLRSAAAASSSSSASSGRASSGAADSAAAASSCSKQSAARPPQQQQQRAASATAAAASPAAAAPAVAPEASSASRGSARSARSVRSVAAGSSAASAPRAAVSTQYSAQRPSPAGSVHSSSNGSSNSDAYVTIHPMPEPAEGLLDPEDCDELEDDIEEVAESSGGDLPPIPPTATRLQRLQTTATTPASALFHHRPHAEEPHSEATGTRLQRLRATATTPAPICFPRPPPSETSSASATPESSLGLSSNFSDAPSKTLSVAIMETLETLDQKIMQMERRFDAWEDRFEQDELLISQQRTANMELASRVVRGRRFSLNSPTATAGLLSVAPAAASIALVALTSIDPSCRMNPAGAARGEPPRVRPREVRSYALCGA